MIRWNRRDGMAEMGKPAAIAAESAPVNGAFATAQSEKRGHKRNAAERSIRRAAPEMPLFGEPVALHPDASGGSCCRARRCAGFPRPGRLKANAVAESRPRRMASDRMVKRLRTPAGARGVISRRFSIVSRLRGNFCFRPGECVFATYAKRRKSRHLRTTQTALKLPPILVAG